MKNRKRRPGTAEQLRFYNKQKWDNTPKNPAAALLRSQTFTDYCLKKTVMLHSRKRDPVTTCHTLCV